MLDSVSSEMFAIPPGDVEALDARIEREVGIAEAAFTCASPLQDSWLELWSEYEEAFADELTLPPVPRLEK